MRQVLLICLVLGGLAGCMDTITPVEMTQTAIGETFARININAATNQAIPPSRDALPKRDGYANRTTDGWNRALQYQVAADGIITLTGYGADGKPGDTGKNADISRSYRSKRPDAILWVGSSM